MRSIVLQVDGKENARSQIERGGPSEPGPMSRIRIVTGARVRRIVGDAKVEGVEYRVRDTVRPRVAEADGVFIRIGWEPRSELVRTQLRVDRAGFVIAGPGGTTSKRGVFAAGDVCSPRWPSIVNAAGQGANAAFEMARLLKKIA